MSFINYPVKEVKEEFEIKIAIYWGLGITISMLIIWYIYGTEYRYSSERIAERLSKKYNKPITEYQTVIATDGKLSADGTEASALIRISNRDSSGPTEIFTLPVISDCSPLVKSCISL